MTCVGDRPMGNQGRSHVGSSGQPGRDNDLASHGACRGDGCAPSTLIDVDLGAVWDCQGRVDWHANGIIRSRCLDQRNQDEQDQSGSHGSSLSLSGDKSACPSEKRQSAVAESNGLLLPFRRMPVAHASLALLPQASCPAVLPRHPRWMPGNGPRSQADPC